MGKCHQPISKRLDEQWKKLKSLAGQQTDVQKSLEICRLEVV